MPANEHFVVWTAPNAHSWRVLRFIHIAGNFYFLTCIVADMEGVLYDPTFNLTVDIISYGLLKTHR